MKAALEHQLIDYRYLFKMSFRGCNAFYNNWKTLRYLSSSNTRIYVCAYEDLPKCIITAPVYKTGDMWTVIKGKIMESHVQIKTRSSLCISKRYIVSVSTIIHL